MTTSFKNKQQKNEVLVLENLGLKAEVAATLGHPGPSSKLSPDSQRA